MRLDSVKQQVKANLWSIGHRSTILCIFARAKIIHQMHFVIADLAHKTFTALYNLAYFSFLSFSSLSFSFLIYFFFPLSFPLCFFLLRPVLTALESEIVADTA